MCQGFSGAQPIPVERRRRGRPNSACRRHGVSIRADRRHGPSAVASPSPGRGGDGGHSPEPDRPVGGTVGRCRHCSGGSPRSWPPELCSSPGGSSLRPNGPWPRRAAGGAPRPAVSGRPACLVAGSCRCRSPVSGGTGTPTATHDTSTTATGVRCRPSRTGWVTSAAGRSRPPAPWTRGSTPRRTWWPQPMLACTDRMWPSSTGTPRFAHGHARGPRRAEPGPGGLAQRG